jgi:hypothetical protein
MEYTGTPVWIFPDLSYYNANRFGSNLKVLLLFIFSVNLKASTKELELSFQL